MATRSTYKTPVTGCSIDTISPAPTGAGGDLIQDNFTNIADALESIATDLGGKANTSSVTSALAGKADSTHTHTTSEITDLSTTLADYATTSALTTGLAGKSDSTHTHAYTEITGTPNLSGFLTSSDLAGYIAEPASDGTSGQVLTTDGAGGRNWTTVTSGSGGTTYTAGTGITISGTTISVTAGTYASATHYHSASNITSGTLDIARIPTGTTSSTVSLGNHTHTAATISNLATVATTGSYNDLSDQPTIPTAYTLPTATTSVLGGVKVDGTTITISNGVISASSSGGSGIMIAGTGLYSAKRDGSTSTAGGQYSLSMGQENVASGKYATALGWKCQSTAEAALSSGYKSNAQGSSATALGNECKSTANYSASFGDHATAGAVSSIAGGFVTTISSTGLYSLATGYRANVNQRATIAVNDNESNVSGNIFSGIKSLTIPSTGTTVNCLIWNTGDVLMVNYHLLDPASGEYNNYTFTVGYTGNLNGSYSSSSFYFSVSAGYVKFTRYATGQPCQIGLFYTQLSGVTSSGGIYS